MVCLSSCSQSRSTALAQAEWVMSGAGKRRKMWSRPAATSGERTRTPMLSIAGWQEVSTLTGTPCTLNSLCRIPVHRSIRCRMPVMSS
ncbi:hypothetical protein D3C76_1344950 [compost metagenome]